MCMLPTHGHACYCFSALAYVLTVKQTGSTRAAKAFLRRYILRAPKFLNNA